MEVNTPLGPWIQLGNLCFLLAGVFSDLLIIRLALVSAYLFLLVNGLLGSPLWPDASSPDRLQVDGIVWSCLNIYVHLSSLVCLWRDELPVQLSNEADALWRLFYRVGGLSRRIFAVEVLPHMHVKCYNAGVQLPTETHFHVLYSGTIQMDIYHKTTGQLQCSHPGYSGQAFDFKDLGLLFDASPFANDGVRATTTSPVVVFAFTKPDMAAIAHQCKSIWQTLMLENLTRLATSQWWHKDPNDSILLAPHPMFAPLEEFEQPAAWRAGSGHAAHRPMQHVARTMVRSWALSRPFGRHPVGIRQHQLPEPPQNHACFQTFYNLDSSTHTLEAAAPSSNDKLPSEEQQLREQMSNYRTGGSSRV